MNIIDAFLIGILQGITEWLPVSSSGQTVLVLVNLLGLKPDIAMGLAFTLHLGTLAAVLVYFRKEIRGIISSATLVLKKDEKSRSEHYNYLSFIIESTVITGIVGIPIYYILMERLSDVGIHINILIGLSLIITGFILKSAKKRGTKTVNKKSSLDVIITGAAQGVAVVPGISRSGATVAALLLRGFNQDEALRISFFMAIPAIIGVNLLDFYRQGYVQFPPEILLTGLISAFIFSYISINFLMELAKRVRFDVFLIIFGAITIGLTALSFLG